MRSLTQPILYSGTDLPELQEYYERMEQARAAAVEVAVKKYRSLTPILCKVWGRSSC
jgi:hypothetical protein